MGKITAFCSKNTTEFSEISRWRWSECWGGDSPARHCRFVPATVKTVPANVGERHAAPGDALAVRTNRRQNGNSLRFVIARRPQADVAISGRQLRFRRKCPVIHPGSARLPRAQSALAMTIWGQSHFNDALCQSAALCRAGLSPTLQHIFGSLTKSSPAGPLPAGPRCGRGGRYYAGPRRGHRPSCRSGRGR